MQDHNLYLFEPFISFIVHISHHHLMTEEKLHHSSLQIGSYMAAEGRLTVTTEF